MTGDNLSFACLLVLLALSATPTHAGLTPCGLVKNAVHQCVCPPADSHSYTLPIPQSRISNTPYKSTPLCTITDATGDGLQDLLCYVKYAETSIIPEWNTNCTYINTGCGWSLAQDYKGPCTAHLLTRITSGEALPAFDRSHWLSLASDFNSLDKLGTILKAALPSEEHVAHVRVVLEAHWVDERSLQLLSEAELKEMGVHIGSAKLLGKYLRG